MMGFVIPSLLQSLMQTKKLYKMPKNWKTYKLRDIASIKIIDGDRGKNYPSKNEFSEKGYCLFLSAKNITKTGFEFSELSFISEDKDNLLGKGKLNINDVILTTRGTVGNVGFYKEAFSIKNVRINSGMVIIRVDEKETSSSYIYQTIKSPIFQEQISSRTSGSAQPQLPIRDLNYIEITLPPLQEQKAIASILSALDDKIELNLQMNKTLEEMATALYKHWFVDFGPFQYGKFVESELGMIPEGWEVKRLDEVARKKSDTFKFSGKDDVVFVNTGDVQEGRFLHSNKISKEGLPGQAKKAIAKEDILYSEIRPKNKRYAYVNFNSSDYVVSTKFMIINPKPNILNRLLYRILTMQSTVDNFNSIAEGRSGTFPQITFDAISEMQIILPPLNIQQEFQNIVSPIELQQDELYLENQTLTTLRDTLLPKLISGEVRVKDIEQMVAAAL